MNKRIPTSSRWSAGVLTVSGAALWLASGCGPTTPDWKLAPTPPHAEEIGTLHLQPDGRPATIPTTFPARMSSARPTTMPSDVRITLTDCRRWALANNLDLKVTTYAPQIAGTLVSQEEAKFESTFFTNANLSETDQPSSSFNNRFNTQGVEPGIRIPLRTGGQLEFASPTSRSDQGGDDSYTSALAASLSQPLLRNAGKETAESSIRIAGYEQQISKVNTRLEVTRVLATIDRVYWRLYATRRQLEVSKQQYDLAMELLEKSQRELAAGKGTEVDVVRAQSGVADRLDAIITADNVVRERQRELKRLLNHDGFDDATILICASDPNPIHFTLDAGQLIDSAMAHRSEMLQQELRLAQQALRIDYAGNQMLPLLSAVYSYRVSGLGDTPADAYDMAFDHNYQGQSLGLRLDIPLGNEAAKSQLRRTLLERQRTLASKSAQALQIRKEVLDAIDQLAAAWNRIIAGRARTILAARTLAAEERQREAGLRTSTDVLDALARLADAQSSEISALADYQIAQIDLAFATGTVLGQARVDWQAQIPATQPSGMP